MSLSNKLIKGVKKFSRQLWQVSRTITKSLMTWLLRGMMLRGRRNRATNAGFVLPTVTMVLLVVVLLTTAIVFRSFDRAKNASNIRVNQTTLAAAAPALERAKAKIQQVFNEPIVAGKSKPEEAQLYSAMLADDSDPNNIKDKFTFGDETRLTLAYDINSSGQIELPDANTPLVNTETLKTAWKFPVDTDNDGKFDSFTLYGIYFRTPTGRAANAARTPIEARTKPMDDGATAACANAVGTSASKAEPSGWYTVGGKAKKSFLVYSVTVPITKEDIDNLADKTQYEAYTGNKGFSALEYQQDAAQIPLDNNAVVYEDDLVIAPGSGIKINGRIMTNGNLMTGKRWDKTAPTDPDVEYYQVSSPESCFYKEENSKIIVGGNVFFGEPGYTKNDYRPFFVHLFKKGAKPTIITVTQPIISSVKTSEIPAKVAYNSRTYAERINYLVGTWLKNNPAGTKGYSDQDPKEVQDTVVNSENLDKAAVRQKAVEKYFKNRTRQVPFKEDGFNSSVVQAQNYIRTGDDLQPPKEWQFPVDPENSATSYNKLDLNISGTAVVPRATEPDKQKDLNAEPELGDRILIGNGLPAQWYKCKDNTQNLGTCDGTFVGNEGKQLIKTPTNAQWSSWTKDKNRYRNTQVTPLSDLGDTGRNGFWEINTAEAPKQLLEGIGGMRVVTGAGIYVDDDGSSGPLPTYPRSSGDPKTQSFLPVPGWDTKFVDPTGSDPKKINPANLKFFGAEGPILVWPDSMPMRGGEEEIQNGDRKSDLLMRATAVYHYAQGAGKDQLPIACVSSYYNPTDKLTAQNETTLATTFWKYPEADPSTVLGKSNNGIVYSFPGRTINKLDDLKRQARLVYPNGRLVNEPLKKALEKQISGGFASLDMGDLSAIDTAICATNILAGATAAGNPPVPHGAIYETAFLDAREVKEIDKVKPQPGEEPKYDVFVEDRQPLEIRATVLDIDKLRQKSIGFAANVVPFTPPKEYLLPNSGLIYATRDDAILDLSDPSQDPETQKRLSPTDLVLDPTRRPSAIMLVNGVRLDREEPGAVNNFREVEKGLILATNIPAYVKSSKNEVGAKEVPSGFNIHQTPGGQLLEEFKDIKLATKTPTWSENDFYNRADPDPNFACRKNDPQLPNCTEGDLWRQARVIADSVTLLSSNFRLGFRDEGDYDLRNNAGNATFDYSQVTSRTGKKKFNLNQDLDETKIGELWGMDIDGDGEEKENNISNLKESEVPASLLRRLNGFFENNFATSAEWFDRTTGYPKDADGTPSNGVQGSSYVNNFVTPIQRRALFPEFVMEICRKIPVSQCGPGDWVVGIDDGSGINSSKKDEPAKKIQAGTNITELLAGTTARPAKSPEDRRYPRRIAFIRNTSSNQLELSSSLPKVLGIKGTDSPNSQTADDQGVVATFNFSSYSSSNRPRLHPTALWYQTETTAKQPSYSNNNNDRLAVKVPSTDRTRQPLLVPILQFQSPTGSPSNNTNFPKGEAIGKNPPQDKNWLQIPTQKENFNLVVVGGDTPATDTSPNGGLPNFVRFIENWQGYQQKTEDAITARISGGIIQFKRSAYGTAPFEHVKDTSQGGKNVSRFDVSIPGTTDNETPYRIKASGGTSPYYMPPNREWGFDVALLSQLPDLFSQRFNSPAVDPDEFYREVGRDDPWVQTLLCAKEQEKPGSTAKPAINSPQYRPTNFCKKFTGDS